MCSVKKYGKTIMNGEWVKIFKVVGFEVLTVVSTNMAVFWVVAPLYRPDDGGSKDL
jgi:hypothetical protein